MTERKAIQTAHGIMWVEESDDLAPNQIAVLDRKARTARIFTISTDVHESPLFDLDTLEEIKERQVPGVAR